MLGVIFAHLQNVYGYGKKSIWKKVGSGMRIQTLNNAKGDQGKAFIDRSISVECLKILDYHIKISCFKKRVRLSAT